MISLHGYNYTQQNNESVTCIRPYIHFLYVNHFQLTDSIGLEPLKYKMTTKK